ncbi:uncharacterized protein LOC111087138 [Limulus polyphemus]|uniref:Uncharacterized protein LOC111087138 n=1 Tax=Limulus polyphemus TaxID=6850 RepID=A0ABM1SXT1_LIMPO|nr:uncharacterized protein LOC111087138 [Limulus polyphemus]
MAGLSTRTIALCAISATITIATITWLRMKEKKKLKAANEESLQNQQELEQKSSSNQLYSIPVGSEKSDRHISLSEQEITKILLLKTEENNHIARKCHNAHEKGEFFQVYIENNSEIPSEAENPQQMDVLEVTRKKEFTLPEMIIKYSRESELSNKTLKNGQKHNEENSRENISVNLKNLALDNKSLVSFQESLSLSKGKNVNKEIFDPVEINSQKGNDETLTKNIKADIRPIVGKETVVRTEIVATNPAETKTMKLVRMSLNKTESVRALTEKITGYYSFSIFSKIAALEIANDKPGLRILRTFLVSENQSIVDYKMRTFMSETDLHSNVPELLQEAVVDHLIRQDSQGRDNTNMHTLCAQFRSDEIYGNCRMRVDEKDNEAKAQVEQTVKLELQSSPTEGLANNYRKQATTTVANEKYNVTEVKKMQNVSLRGNSELETELQSPPTESLAHSYKTQTTTTVVDAKHNIAAVWETLIVNLRGNSGMKTEQVQLSPLTVGEKHIEAEIHKVSSTNLENDLKINIGQYLHSSPVKSIHTAFSDNTKQTFDFDKIFSYKNLKIEKPDNFGSYNFDNSSSLWDASNVLNEMNPESPFHVPLSDGQNEGSTDRGTVDSDFKPTESPQVESAIIVYEFEVSQDLCSRLIGHKKKHFNRIKRRSNTNISFKRHPLDPNFKFCAVEGTENNINTALRLIRKRFPVNHYPDVTLTQVNVPMTCDIPIPESLQGKYSDGSVAVMHKITKWAICAQTTTGIKTQFLAS